RTSHGGPDTGPESGHGRGVGRLKRVAPRSGGPGRDVERGGAGNRTRVLRRLVRASPGSARFASARGTPSREAVGVAGPVAFGLAARAPPPGSMGQPSS